MLMDWNCSISITQSYEGWFFVFFSFFWLWLASLPLGFLLFFFSLSLVMGEECEMVVTVRGMDFVSAIWLRCVRPLTMDMESGFEI